MKRGVFYKVISVGEPLKKKRVNAGDSVSLIYLGNKGYYQYRLSVQKFSGRSLHAEVIHLESSDKVRELIEGSVFNLDKEYAREQIVIKMQEIRDFEMEYELK
jgi:hypothetical protein